MSYVTPAGERDAYFLLFGSDATYLIDGDTLIPSPAGKGAANLSAQDLESKRRDRLSSFRSYLLAH